MQPLDNCSLTEYIRSPMENTSLAHILFPQQYRRKVLAVLFTRAGEWIHLRELERLTGAASVGSLKKELDALVSVGLVNIQRMANQTQFAANEHHPVFAELRSLVQKTTGLVPLLQQALAPLGDKVTLACVFGSVARGAESAQSDVDVLLLGELTFGEAVNALFDAQAQLGREINPKVMTVAEWQAKKRDGNAFVHDVLSKPKLFVKGVDDGL